MARQEHVLSVFVASPSDVIEERNKLEEIIHELNIVWSRELNIRLDLVRWETHAYPDIGDDPQNVLNRQIPSDWDIFIGIMWYRFGTKTTRFGSGTVEEFERAKLKHQSDPSSITIMFYFKDEALPPSKINPKQLSKINKFRTSLGRDGGLYCQFTTLEQFERLVRMHLSRCVQFWNKKLGTIRVDGNGTRAIRNSNNEKIDNEEDFGIFELLEAMDNKFEEVADVLNNIAEDLEALTHSISKRVKQISAFRTM